MPAAGTMRIIRPGEERPIPGHVLIPRCEGCCETYMGPDDEERVDAAIGHAEAFE